MKTKNEATDLKKIMLPAKEYGAPIYKEILNL